MASVEKVHDVHGKVGKRTTWKDRLKIVWWTRGVLTAVGLVGVMDHLGFARDGWLRVSHAIASRYTELAQRVIEYINLHLPFQLNYSSVEINIITVLLLITIPFFVSGTMRQIDRIREYGLEETEWLEVGFIMFILIMMVATDVVFIVVLSGTAELAAPPSWSWILDVVIVWTAVLGLYFLWGIAKAYTKVILITLSFIATLELFYLAPAIQTWMTPAIEWIDPRGDSQNDVKT